MARLTEEEAKAKDDAVGAVRLERYKGIHTKHQYECQKCKTVFLCIPATIWRHKKINCLLCSYKLRTFDKLLDEEQAKVNDDKIGAVRLEKYRGNKVRHNYRCNICGQSFLCKPNSLWTYQQLPNCSSCSHKLGASCRKLTEEISKNNDNIVGAIRLEQYKGYDVKHRYQCPKCNKVFLRTPHSVWGQKQIHCSSCSKSRSKMEIYIEKLLLDKGIIPETQKKFNDLRGKNQKGYLYFDFYLPDLNILIEYQGKQHYEPANNTKWNFKEGIARDRLKVAYCRRKDTPKLYRIPYTYAHRLEEIIDRLLAGKPMRLKQPKVMKIEEI